MLKTDAAWQAQQQRNRDLIQASAYMRDTVTSKVLPYRLDLAVERLTGSQIAATQAIEIQAARIAIQSLASLAKIGELDHLGGGLDLISALTMTLAVTDFSKVEYTIENAHCSIGYYALLAALGYISEEKVVDEFRRGLDIPGHVSWVPGGTQLNGGRLGVMIPVAAGQALGKKARCGKGAWVICHTGDAGWISGQALNGFNVADLHGAPLTFVMHRNGIQLSGSNAQVMDKDPRSIISSMGIDIIEIPSLLDTETLWYAYREAYGLAQAGRPSMIYPTGIGGHSSEVRACIGMLGMIFGIEAEVEAFAASHHVPLETPIWIPGALMSYRDVVPMLECIFLCNDLPGGKGHHDGHMIGRDVEAVLSNPMLCFTESEANALAELRAAEPRTVVTQARPAPGTVNLVVPAETAAAVVLPEAGTLASARAGVQEGYAVVAQTFPDDVFIVSCDLDPSTKLAKARKFLKADHQFEVSIEEQAAVMMAAGLAMAAAGPKLNVISTFAAFYEGIAREGLELWRYHRNLNGVNEGLNVALHMSHVGACTGRDHFAGWSLDWINLAIGYLPYLDRFYAPCDARAAFVAVLDQAARYGAHIMAIPRDNLPVLASQDGTAAVYNHNDSWTPLTALRTAIGARHAILAFGATAVLAAEAFDRLGAVGTAVDVYVVNGLPFGDGELETLFSRYKGLVTVEDGLIGTRTTGLRGFAALVMGKAWGSGISLGHVGIVDPRIAPAEGHYEVWQHFGLTADAIIGELNELGCK